jgi:hypothetical protein
MATQKNISADEAHALRILAGSPAAAPKTS